MDADITAICDSFVESIKSVTGPDCLELVQIWSEIGLDRDVMVDRLQLLSQHASRLFKTAVAKEAGVLRTIQKDVVSYKKQVQDLKRELGHSLDDSLCDQTLMTLLERNNYLTGKLRELADEKMARMAEVTELDEKIESLVEQLGQKAKLQPLSTVPKSAELDERKAYVYSLEKLKKERLDSIEREQRSICDLYMQLERSPEGAYEQSLAVGAPLTLIVEPMMERVASLRQRLQTEADRNRHRADQLRDRLVCLWRLLRLSSERENACFLSTYSGSRPSDIKHLESEVRKQEAMKLGRLGIVITNIRTELLDGWRNCCYSEAQREQFAEFHRDDYSEDLLNSHTAELEVVNNLYESNKLLWDQVARRARLWEKMLDLEFRANNPGRFNNRGGRLLQEEKERRKLLMQIPKLEQEILSSVETSEAATGRPILIFGEAAAEYISRQWNDIRAQKENQKLERQQAKVQLLKHEMQEGCKPNLSRRRLVTTPVRSPLAMMTRSNTPLSVAPKSAGISTVVAARPPTHSKSTLRKVTALPRPRRLNLQKNSFKANPNSTLCNQRAGHTTHLDASNLSTYSTFTRNLHQKSKGDNCRSSAVTPSTPVAPIATTPRRYRDRLGLPFLL